MRCVAWMGVFGMIASLIASTACTSAQTFDPLDQPQFDFPDPGAFDLGASTAADMAGLDSDDEDGLAGDLPVGQHASPLAALAPATLSGGQAAQGLLFGGHDLWRNGIALYGGVEFLGDTAADNGFVIRLFASEALERYQSERFTYVSDISRASVLAGWRFKLGAFELKILAGPDLEHRASMPDVRDKRWRGSHGGARIALDGWAEPTPDTMLSASFYATTIAGSYGARLAAGWRMLDRFWVGPEMSGSSDEFSRQTRIGLHLTGLQLAVLEWSAAAGYVRDSFGRGGVYTRLGVMLRQ
ncbi:cellulose biosynthesis protein BcsS [Rhodopseudomonas sp. WA056]|uniref:cellulose biosynthesis protein BcsS n=1 Tax=Rhodopseudomonas sp. WA056 TaxID=2269367 RepID=UPI0013DFDC2B|nr:cellulose biosynthesis protein BcsS [Rhodopseudomonas sp. WA056]NEW87869.1 cellulose biosynthesis protein BcsS [Rhodopseudomonas sp. WA056]